MADLKPITCIKCGTICYYTHCESTTKHEPVCILCKHNIIE